MASSPEPVAVPVGTLASTATLKILESGIWWLPDVVEAFLLLSEVLDDIDLASSGVKQKNSSSADDVSPNLLLALVLAFLTWCLTMPKEDQITSRWIQRLHKDSADALAQNISKKVLKHYSKYQQKRVPAKYVSILSPYPCQGRTVHVQFWQKWKEPP